MMADDPQVRFEVEDAACRLAREDAPSRLPASLRAAIERAEQEPGPEGAPLCHVRCSPTDARELRDYFERAAAVLQGRGEYDRSTACAQTAERISRALAGRPRS